MTYTESKFVGGYSRVRQRFLPIGYKSKIFDIMYSIYQTFLEDM